MLLCETTSLLPCSFRGRLDRNYMRVPNDFEHQRVPALLLCDALRGFLPVFKRVVDTVSI